MKPLPDLETLKREAGIAAAARKSLGEIKFDPQAAAIAEITPAKRVFWPPQAATWNIFGKQPSPFALTPGEVERVLDKVQLTHSPRFTGGVAPRSGVNKKAGSSAA